MILIIKSIIAHLQLWVQLFNNTFIIRLGLFNNHTITIMDTFFNNHTINYNKITIIQSIIILLQLWVQIFNNHTVIIRLLLFSYHAITIIQSIVERLCTTVNTNISLGPSINIHNYIHIM